MICETEFASDMLHFHQPIQIHSQQIHRPPFPSLLRTSHAPHRPNLSTFPLLRRSKRILYQPSQPRPHAQIQKHNPTPSIPLIDTFDALFEVYRGGEMRGPVVCIQRCSRGKLRARDVGPMRHARSHDGVLRIGGREDGRIVTKLAGDTRDMAGVHAELDASSLYVDTVRGHRFVDLVKGGGFAA